jgi:Tol biopolymer transport system component
MVHRYRNHFRALIGVLLLSLSAAAIPLQAQTRQQCFPQTGYCLEDRFASFWIRNGGLPVFGYPLSNAQAENGEDGQPRVTQWLERERFELHPANAAPYDVQLGRLGVSRLAQLGQRWQDFPRASPQTLHYFAETGQAIHPQFWDYWRSHGLDFGDDSVSMRESIALFGYPISPAREERSEGKTVLTQWYERARFEYHPDLPKPYQVLLGRLGAEVGGEVRSSPGLIAFATSISPEADLASLRLIQPNGQGMLTLGNMDGTQEPSWSANGQRIAFSYRGEVTVAERSGQVLTRFDGVQPTLSPDGSQIAFVDRNGNIGAGLVAGSGIAELTTTGVDSQPVWSPDGSRIVFETRRDGGETEIYVMNADGSQQRNLSRNTSAQASRNYSPTWSPDGRQLAYIAERLPAGRLPSAIVLVNADGSTIRRINVEQSGIGAISGLHWSPDGSALVFAASAKGNQDIFVLEAAGNELRPLTSDAAPDTQPSWAPDSRSIAFGSLREGVQAVYIKHLEDGSITRLTEPGSSWPVWSPR